MQVRGGPKTVVTIYLTSKKAKRCLLICRGSNQVKGKSKYGVPIFLPNGNVNPAYLAAERKEAQAMSKKNQQTSEAKRKALISKKEFELADYVRKKIGNVGSGKDYYSSGR